MQDSQYTSDSLSEDVAGPNLKAGNVVYQMLVYMVTGECAKLNCSIRVSIVLISRSYSVFSCIASCALAMLVWGTASNKVAAA